MAFSLIAHGAAAGTTTVASVTLNTTGANLVLIAVGSQPGSVTPPTVTSSKAGTITLVKAQIGGDVRNALYAILNPTVGTGHVFTVTSVSGNTANPSLEVLAFATGAGTASIDGTAVSATGNAIFSLKPGTFTPAGNNELLITSVAFKNSSTATVDSSYVLADTAIPWVSAKTAGSACAYQIQTTGTARNPIWTFGVSSGACTIQAAFYVPASGNGTLIVSKATSPAGSSQPFAFNSFSGSSITTLYTAPGGTVTSATSLSYSPDGTLMLFGALGSNAGIYRMTSAGASVTRLSTTSGDDQGVYSPDQTLIAFVRPVAGVNHIFTMTAAGASVTQLTNNAGEAEADPCWNADGTHLFYTRIIIATQEKDLYVMTSAGATQTLYFSLPVPHQVSQTRLSSTGLYLTYRVTLTTGASDGTTGIWRTDTATLTNATRLTSSGLPALPTWAPGDTGVAFMEASGGSNVDWSSLAATTQIVAFNGATVDYPVYAPNGLTLAFLATSGTTIKSIAATQAPAIFTLTDGTSRTFSGLAPASTYRTTEVAISGWSTGYTVSNGTISAIVIAANATTTALATNTLSSPSVTTQAIRMLRQGPYITDPEEHFFIFHSRTEVLIQAGVGNADQPVPALVLQWSDDYGNSWSSGLSLAMGAATAYLTRLFVNRLGRSRDRVYRVYTDDPVIVALVDGILFAEKGTS